MKKGGKVKRRRAKTRQPTQSQRQVVNINMGGGGGGGARIGSTHTFSQPPEFYHAIREVPNQPVNYGDNPIRGKIPNQEPVAPTSVVSNPNPLAPKTLITAPPPPSYKRNPASRVGFFSPEAVRPTSTAEFTDDRRRREFLATAEPHDDRRVAMPETGGMTPQASSSATASGMSGQLPRRMAESPEFLMGEFSDAERYFRAREAQQRYRDKVSGKLDPGFSPASQP